MPLGKGTFKATEKTSHPIKAVNAAQTRALGHFPFPSKKRPKTANIRTKVERRKPAKPSNRPYKNTETTRTACFLHCPPFNAFAGSINPFAKTNRLKAISSNAIISGRNPGPGLLSVPSFSRIPPTAKKMPTASQKRLPTASVPIRFIESPIV